MAKLFAFENTAVTAANEQIDTGVSSDISIQLDMISVCHESMTMANTQLDLVSSIKTRLYDDNGSMYVGMEHYAPLIENIANNLGVRANLPSLEAYSDKYASRAAKEIALESISSFFKAIWDRLVGFVKALFNAFKGLIMGFKNSETKKLQTMEKILEQAEKLVASNATLSNTDKISTTLPSILSSPGISEFSVSDLIMQSNIRIPSFISTVNVINKADGTVNEELRTSMSNIANKLADECKTASDLHGTIVEATKSGTLPIEQMSKINDICTKAKDINFIIGAVNINYFPDTQLSVVSEQQLPPVLLSEIKSISNYKSSIVKKLAASDSIRNLEVYVADVTTDSEVLKTFKRVWVCDSSNTSAPGSMEPIGSAEELSKLVKVVIGLTKNSLTIDARKITDSFTKLLESIQSSSVKLSSTYTDISLVLSKLKKEVSAADIVSAVPDDGNIAETSMMFKLLADKISTTEKYNSAVRTTILSASKELTDINSTIVRVKNETLDAYIKYFMTNLQQFS